MVFTQVTGHVEVEAGAGCKTAPLRIRARFIRLFGVGQNDRLRHRPTSCPAASSSGSRSPALASRPDIVFADEPTGNLDSKASAEVLGLLRQSVREFGQTVVMVTHAPVAASYADRVIFLADGVIAGGLDRPTPESVLDAMKSLGE
jgi:putative ABC transport system ATP-binding protein